MISNYFNSESGVSKYEIHSNKIDVYFKGNSKKYTYSYLSAGVNNVENMKMYALRNKGLNTYINKYCKYLYER